MIYLDIEVIQQEPYGWMIRPHEIEAPANYRDPDKIAAYVESALAKYHEDLKAKSSLEPMLGGVIVCVGCAVDDADPVVVINDDGDETGERLLLGRIERALCSADRLSVPIVSWNGAYDWAWLAKRAIRHGRYDLARRMTPPKPWGSRTHVDAREPWTRLDRYALSRLQDVARYLGIEVADTVTGAQTTQLWETDRAAVVEHCRSDVSLLRAIAQIEARAGWLDMPIPEAAPAVPPPRGSVADLAPRVARQAANRPDLLSSALETAGIPASSSGTLDSLDAIPSSQLRALLVALGGRP